MWFYHKKHKNQDVIISDHDHAKLPKHIQNSFRQDHNQRDVTPTHTVSQDDDNFILSMAVGMATDNIILGMTVGGSFEGAVVGESIAEAGKQEEPAFDGGSGGGGGATGSWDSSNASGSSDSGSL